MTTMTAAQLAQQNNRDTGGKYAPKTGADQGDQALSILSGRVERRGDLVSAGQIPAIISWLLDAAPQPAQKVLAAAPGHPDQIRIGRETWALTCGTHFFTLFPLADQRGLERAVVSDAAAGLTDGVFAAAVNVLKQPVPPPT